VTTIAYAPVLLEKKAEQIRIDMGFDRENRHRVRTQYESPDRQCVIFTVVERGTVLIDIEYNSWQQIFARALVRPFAMFFREPIIQLLGLYMAFVYVFCFPCVYTVLIIPCSKLWQVIRMRTPYKEC
jgi:hypothetical protein